MSRRTFLQGLAALPLALSMPRAADAATLRVRYDLTTTQGAQMLEVYANAVREMQAMGPENPLSWMWQWYTHFVNGTTTKGDELTRVFGEYPTLQRSFAEEAWNTCQSHAGQNPNHFLPWHRMFVYYLEKIVGTVSGRPDFALPYWDYTSNDPARRGVVPEQFRLPDDPVYGVLYRANRSSLANSGESIQKNQPTDVMDISDALAKSYYNTVDGVPGFCRAIDSGIHGRIHVLVGNSRGMGAVPYAGNDPLFWVHHANIDRMWASWNRNGGRNPTNATTYPWIDTRFVMADGNGNRVSRPLKSFFSVLSLGYDFDRFFPRPAPSTTLLEEMAKTPGARDGRGGAISLDGLGRRVGGNTTEATLGPAPTRVTLRPVGMVDSKVMGLDSHTGKRTYLVLKNLHTWKQPEVLFHVYITPMAGGPLTPANYAGNINFFDAEFHDHGHGKKATALGENFYSFDVTDILRRIEASGGSRDGLHVVFVPAGTPAPNSGAMVSTIDLEQH